MRALLLTVAFTLLGAVEKNGVRVEARLETGDGGSGLVIATFTPTGLGAWHLYPLELPAGAAGIPTSLSLRDGGGWLEAAGPLRTQTPVTELHQPPLDPVPVFVDGPVVLELPVRITAASGTPATLVVGYMACNDSTCLIPVQGLELSLAPPGTTPLPPPVETIDPITPPGDRDPVAPQGSELLGRLLAFTDSPPPIATPGAAELTWHHAERPGEVAALIRAAQAAGEGVFIDVSGKTCTNCRINEVSHFPRPAIHAALSELRRIHIDTDQELMAEWQRSTLGTDARPYYVVIHGDTASTWSATLDGNTREFAAFLRGGAGRDLVITGIWSLLLACVLGGLFTLLMPCTYPMIPLTVNFFTKQAEGGRRLLPLALTYGLGITVSFAGLGVLVGAVFGGTVAQLAGNPWTNLVIGLLFLVLGLSLLGAFFLRLPSGLLDRLGGSTLGVAGALVMGLTFAITAFTCTAPVAGLILAGAASSGDWFLATVGMTIYGATIAAPFVVLALAPDLMRRLPRAGQWMAEFKVVGGIVEIAAAFKFLFTSAAIWGLGWLLTREVVFGLWALAAALAALFIAGAIRFAGVTGRPRVTPLRLVWILLFGAIAVAMTYRVFGGDVGMIEGFLVGD